MLFFAFSSGTRNIPKFLVFNFSNAPHVPLCSFQNTYWTPPTRPLSFSLDIGAVLAYLGISAHSAKEHHDHKKATKLQKSSKPANQQQLFDPSQQYDAQQGLTDEHLASVPPPQQVESE